jgi:hypothetical protein
LLSLGLQPNDRSAQNPQSVRDNQSKIGAGNDQDRLIVTKTVRNLSVRLIFAMVSKQHLNVSD